MDEGQRRIWRSFKEIFPDQTASDAALVMTYELGDAIKAIFYTKQRGLRRASIAEVKKALGDLVAQVKLICSHFGLDFDEVEHLGTIAILEHLNHIREGKE